MKGIIFTEILAMAEESFGEEAVDQVIEATYPPSGGAYTALGNYPCEELSALVGGFAAYDGTSSAALQRLFGHWMMQSYARHYPQFFKGRDGSLDMLYRSPRPSADFCHGLIEAGSDDFGETVRIARRDSAEDGLTVATSRINTGCGP
jgi:hypothetical protein